MENLHSCQVLTCRRLTYYRSRESSDFSVGKPVTPLSSGDQSERHKKRTNRNHQIGGSAAVHLPKGRGLGLIATIYHINPNRELVYKICMCQGQES